MTEEELIEATVDKIEQYATIHDYKQVGHCVREAIEAATAKLEEQLNTQTATILGLMTQNCALTNQSAKLRDEADRLRNENVGLATWLQASLELECDSRVWEPNQRAAAQKMVDEVLSPEEPK